MGRSAKFTKRPSKEQKAASKIAKSSNKPLPPPPKKEAKKEEAEEGEGKVKKRTSMRAKVDKASRSLQCFSILPDSTEAGKSLNTRAIIRNTT
jgi:hypothetical protein